MSRVTLATKGFAAANKLCVEADRTSHVMSFHHHRRTLYQLLESSIDWGTWLAPLVEFDGQLSPFGDTFGGELEFLYGLLANITSELSMRLTL